ncbi:MAG: hypothetical protein IKE94_06090 [Aeriscardovia sp.]|nr:hypothetical protein [Aeriscardovia sp.]MBR2754185.1 hypothetical protein [Lachnospiraceae bacterium]
MGLFSKKSLTELLEQRPNQLLANHASALFFPDPTWAYEKDTGLPMMFRFSARLSDIPLAVRSLRKKEAGMDAIGRKEMKEVVDVNTFQSILKKRGCYTNALVPMFMELYGMKEDLVDHCGTLEQLFADASYEAAMKAMEWAAKNHAGAELFRQALSKAPDKNALFPYAGLEEDSRDMVTKKYDFCESQRVFLKNLLADACRHYDDLKHTTDPKKDDYYELQTALRVVILWLAMHKVPWALKKYYDGSLMTDNKGEVQKHFPLGYFYSNIDTNYFHDIALRNKAYAYSIEKANDLLRSAEIDRAEMIKQMSEAKKK